MKRIIFLHLALLFIVKVMLAQHPAIVKGEYYLDNDPGFGMGIPIVLSQDSIVDVTFDVELSSINLGYHQLFVRVKDENGIWSEVYNQNIFKQDKPAFTSSLVPEIVYMEYYFDEDPGFGLGINIPITADTAIDESFMADISPLSNGYHKLFVRVRDENGEWSLVNKQDIFKQDKPISSSGTIPQIVYMEYYFDEDPGFGLGMNIPITADTAIDESFMADISPLSNGYHKLFVRVRDENGEWSLVNRQDIFKQDKPISSSGTIPQIVCMEYYFDDDPGFGLGVNVPITADSIIEESFQADISTLGNGYHQLFVRVKDENGHWSLINKQDIYKADHLASQDPMPLLVQAEYYFDDDPGFGLGFPIAVVPDSIVDLSLAPELNMLGLGNHKMFTRVKDEFGRWSLVYTHAFTISLGADFKADKVLALEDETVHFTDLSTGAPTSWLWNFGDGTTSTLQNPAHIYLAAGVYDVSLSVTSNGNTHSITKNDYIQVVAPQPEIAFSPSSLNFENVLVNEMASLWLTVSNTGTADLVIEEITYGNPFFATFSGTIAPGSSQTIEVNFAPQAALFYEDVLVFHTNAGDVEFPVSGTGEAPETCWQFSFQAWNFGWTDIETGTTKNLTITNCGTQTLFINANLSGDLEFTFSPSYFNLDAGETQAIEISFNPTDIDWYESLLHFSSAAGETDIPLEGKGYYPSFPPQLTFSETFPFNGISGVSPEIGPSATWFEYQVIYSDPDNDAPMNTYPQAGIDFNGDGDFLDPGESLTSMTEVDPADQNFVDGKVFSMITNLPKNMLLGYRFFAFDALGNEATGEATAYKSGPSVSDDRLDLAIYANNITFSNSTPEVGDEIVINATIFNTSDYLAQNVPVAVYIENQLVYQTTLANVYPQSSAAISFNYIFAYADYYPVKVVIDEGNLIIEDNELNNFAIRPVLVGEVTLPGFIALTSGLNPGQAYPYCTLHFYGHASYESTKFRGSNVSGAQVVMTIHETGATFSGYTNANGDFNIYFTVPGTPGNYSVSAEVTDFTLTANTSIHYFSVVPVINPEDPPPPGLTYRPDLTIQNWDINWSGDPVVNTTNSISGTFYNIGNLAAQNVTVFGYVDGMKIFEDVFENVPVGGSQSFGFETVFSNTGYHTVNLVVDPLQTIVESVESNNTAAKTRYIYPMLPDLTPLEITFSNNSPMLGEEFSITAKVKNLQWTTTAATTVAFYVDENTLLGIVPLAGIAGGQTKNVTLAGQFIETPDWHTIKAVVDPENLVEETSEQNQEINGIIYIEQPMADLALSAISASDYGPLTGDLITFSVTVVNNGNMFAENFWVRFRVNGELVGDSILINTLFAGESITLTSASWQMTAAPVQVCVTADESNQVPELNEYNNQRCQMFGSDLQPSILPYYAGNSASNRLNILVGEPFQILSRIFNNGNFRAGEVEISYSINGETAATHTIPFINGGSFSQSELEYQFNETGDLTMQIIADKQDKVDEINESNNTVLLYLHVYENQPDLFISNSMIAISNINPEQNEWVDISASWFNAGNEPSGPFHVQLFVDQVLYSDTIADGLQPGASGSILWPGIFSTWQIGNHVIRVVLDCENAIAEISENNNQASKNFIVGAAPDFGITAFSISENDPALGDLMDILATIANVGGAEASATIVFYFQTLDGIFPIGSETFILPKNGTTEISAQWLVQVEAGFIKAEIAGSNPPEANLSNNFAQQFFGGQLQVTGPIADIVVDEDTPPFEVADLMQVFQNVDQSALSFEAGCDQPGINLLVTASNKLSVSLAADWNGSATAIVTAQNLYGQIAKDTFEILVNPMPDYPDLTPTEFSFSGNYVYSGYPFGLTVEVKNLNWEPSGPTTVNFIEGVDNLLGAMPLPGLGSGQSVSLTLHDVIFENPGAFAITAIVDPEHLVEETNETNQVITQNITVYEPLSDLTPLSLSFSENSPFAGTSFDISVEVKNQSIFTSEATAINIFDGNTLLNSLSLPAIPGNETLTVTLHDQIVVTSGWHTIKAVVDPENLVEETNEQNQQITRNLFLKEPLPDLTLFGVMASTTTSQSGDPVNFKATVSNIGLAASGSFVVRFWLNGSLLGDSVMVSGLSAGQSQLVTSGIWYMQNSPANLCVTVDESNQIVEISEENNTNCRLFGVDLQPSKIPYYSANSPANRLNILKGETVQLFARAYNNGTFGINEASVDFVFNNEVLETDIVPVVPAGSFAEATVFHAFHQTGNFILQIITDYENEIHETDETNNVVNLFISVYNDLPDLFIGSEHIAPGSINPGTGEVIDVNATYFNHGNVPTGPFLVSLFADDEFLADTLVGSVEPGEEASVSWQEIYSSYVPGIHILKVELDGNNQLTEVNELNNVATRAIIVGEAPDFLIADLQLSDTFPAMGEPIRFSAEIHNNGGSGAQSMFSLYYLDMNDTVLISSTPVFIPRHGSTEINIPWYAQITEGYIFAEISGSDPPEANLTNNRILRYLGKEIMVVNPVQDIETMEDTPPFEIADLSDVFENVDETALFYQVQSGDTGVGLEVTADNKLIISPELNWTGTTFGVVTASNLYGQVANDTFNITVISYPAEHFLQIPAGWSGLSSWVMPHNPDIENVFAPVTNNLIILQTMEEMYFPGQNINTMVNWENQDAFKIKVTESCNLRISGFEELNKNLELNSGWNLTPVICNLPVDPALLFPQGLKIAKDVAGTGIYWPEFGINTLGSMLPGKAYFVKMNNPGTIIFPPNDFSSLKTTVTPENTDIQSPWGSITQKPLSNIIAIPANLNAGFTNEMFIGAFTPEGICAGALAVQPSKNQVLVVNADDPTTPGKDGFSDGEPLDFRIWNVQTGEESDLKVVFSPGQPNHSGMFAANGVSALFKAEIVPAQPESTTAEFRIFPNPAHEHVKILGAKDGTEVTVTVFGQSGQLIFTGIFNSGYQLDVSGYPAGMYFIKLETCQTMKFEKLVIE